MNLCYFFTAEFLLCIACPKPTCPKDLKCCLKEQLEHSVGVTCQSNLQVGVLVVEAELEVEVLLEAQLQQYYLPKGQDLFERI